MTKDSEWVSNQQKNQVLRLLPVSRINIEVAAFDIQRIKKEDIQGVEYQNGPQKNFWNVREYVFYRDEHICQNCRGKSKDNVLEVHHLVSRQTGGNSPDNLITLCSTCHEKVSRGESCEELRGEAKQSNHTTAFKGKVKLNVKPPKSFKSETFMSVVRWKLVDKLEEEGNIVSHTYGYITKQNRTALSLPKSHTNDAFVIASGRKQKKTDVLYSMLQVRKCNRKLFKGDRSHIRNTAQRKVFGFQRFDKVLWNGVECFIFGRRQSGYFDLRKLDGEKISSSAKVVELVLLENAKTLLVERKTASSPTNFSN